jgi:hypothetical protein
MSRAVESQGSIAVLISCNTCSSLSPYAKAARQFRHYRNIPVVVFAGEDLYCILIHLHPPLRENIRAELFYQTGNAGKQKIIDCTDDPSLLFPGLSPGRFFQEFFSVLLYNRRFQG